MKVCEQKKKKDKWLPIFFHTYPFVPTTEEYSPDNMATILGYYLSPLIQTIHLESIDIPRKTILSGEK
jgi:hypothetical protein